MDGDNDKENKLRKEPDELQCYVCGERNSVKSKIMDHIRDTHFQDVKNSMFGRPREFQCHECRLVTNSFLLSSEFSSRQAQRKVVKIKNLDFSY